MKRSSPARPSCGAPTRCCVLRVLYAASLPACYLMKRGVPALYATEKLSEQKYVFQRIFETGVMLEGVMSPGGIKVAHDVEPNSDETIAGS